MSVEAKNEKSENLVREKISEEVSDFSDVSSGLSLSSQDTNGEDFDGDTVGSVTTDSKERSENSAKEDQVTKEPPKQEVEKKDISKPKTLNIKTIAPINNGGKESHESELARMVKRLTGNSFQNTSSSHPSREKSWVPVSKSSGESQSSSSPEEMPSDSPLEKIEQDVKPVEPILETKTDDTQGAKDLKNEDQEKQKDQIECKKDDSSGSKSGKSARQYKRRVGSLRSVLIILYHHNFNIIIRVFFGNGKILRFK